MSLRIGFGFDTHQLKEGYPFWLGGISISHSKGATGHSDADVLIHAICDALLGAAGLRDIGYNFPDTNPAYKGIESKVLLKETIKMLRKHNYSINNIDSTIVLQNPKVSDYIPEMIKILAPILGISNQDLSIKAKTSEKLGFIGREEGISAYAVALITDITKR